MPSATNSPIVGRKSIPTIPGVNSSRINSEYDMAGTSTESTEQLVSQKNRLPLSVASMVRRFERDGSSKGRAGSPTPVARPTRTTGTIGGKQQQQMNTPLSSRTSSLSSSQGLLHAVMGDGIDENVTKMESNKTGKGNEKKNNLKNTSSASKKPSSVNQAVMSDITDNNEPSGKQEDGGDNSVQVKTDASHGTKKTPITMTSVVRAATAPKDHQASKEHKAALAAKRRATAPTSSNSATVKASRSNISANRNRSSRAESSKAETPIATPTSLETNADQEGSLLSKTNKANPVSTFIHFHHI